MSEENTQSGGPGSCQDGRNRGREDIYPLWFAPAIFLGSFIFAFAMLLWFLHSNAYKLEKEELSADVSAVQNTVNLQLNGTRDYLLMLAKERGSGDMDAKSFQERAVRYVTDHPEMINITWVDADFVVRDVAPFAANKQILGLRLDLPEPKRASHLAKQQRQPVYTRPFEAIQGKPSFEIWVPVFHNGAFLGLFGGVYSYEKLLYSVVGPKVRKTCNVKVVDVSGKVFSELPPVGPLDEGMVYRVPMTPPENGFILFYGCGRGGIGWELLLLELLCMALVLAMAYSMLGLKREIGEHKRADEALRESEELHRLTLSSISDAVFMTDDSGSFRYVCPNVDIIFGYSVKEVQAIGNISILFGKELFAPSELDDLRELSNIELDVFGKAGKKRSLLVSVKRINIKGSTRLYTCRDITKRKRAEEAFGESEKKYQTLIQKIGAAVIVHGPDTRILICNQMAQKLLGLTEDEMIGRSCDNAAWHFFREDGTIMPHAEYPVNRVFATRRSLAYYTVGVHRPGNDEDVWVMVNADPVLDSAGAIVHVIVTFVDITDRKRTQELVKKSEEKYRTLFEESFDGLFVTSPGGKILDMNKKGISMFGYDTKTEILNLDLAKDVYAFPPDRARIISMVNEKGAAEYEVSVKKKNGDTMLTYCSLTAVKDRDGVITAYRGIIRDITERKQAELEIQKLNLDLIKKNEEMENFLYITTHDLRGPLLNIQGFSRSLESYAGELDAALAAVPLTPETRGTLEKLVKEHIPESLKFILASARKMDSLIASLLKVSRMGRMVMNPETLEMNELLKKVLDSMRYQLDEAGAKIIPGDLPRCKADPGAVSQLFTNLLDNAVKYRHKGRALVVNVTGAVKGGMAVYAVADNGSGIPAEDIHSIWDLFYRFKAAEGEKGEGIGLPIVKRIIEKNGGTIRVESEEGKGSVFYVELPVAGI